MNIPEPQMSQLLGMSGNFPKNPELRSFLSHGLLLMIEEKLFWALEFDEADLLRH